MEINNQQKIRNYYHQTPPPTFCLLLAVYPCDDTALINPFAFCFMMPQRLISCSGLLFFLIAKTRLELNLCCTGLTSSTLPYFEISHNSYLVKLPDTMTYSPINPVQVLTFSISSTFNCTLLLRILPGVLYQSAVVFERLLAFFPSCSDPQVLN